MNHRDLTDPGRGGRKNPADRRYYHAEVTHQEGHTAEIVIIHHDQHGSVIGEMSVRFYPFDEPLAARLEVFYASWLYLAAHPDVLEALSSVATTAPSPADVAAALETIGFVESGPRSRDWRG